MGKIVVGRWDCSYCGTKGIRGSERECPNCGRPRGEDVKFYVDDPKDYVPEDEATKISKEPDWMCEFCGSYNSAKLTKCMSCGAERGKSKDYFQVQEAIPPLSICFGPLRNPDQRSCKRETITLRI